MPRIDSNKGAKCEYCSGYMLVVDSCDKTRAIIDGKIYKRNGNDYGSCGIDNDRCSDCGSKSIHHFGCDNEYCPVCGDQFAFCDCNKTNFLD